MSGVAKFAIGQRRALSGKLARFDRRACPVAFGGAIEHLGQCLMPQQRTRTRARMKLELREDMTPESRQMNVDPVVVPIDLRRSERMPFGIGGCQRLVEIADI